MAEMPVLSSIKKLDGKIGVLTELSTTDKSSLVKAVNENVNKINDCLERLDGLSSEVELVLVNGWTYAYTNINYKAIAYKTGNMVVVNGNIYNGTTSVGTIITTLPEKVRPKKTKYINIIGIDGAMRRFSINPTTGDIKIELSAWATGVVHFNFSYGI